MTIDANDLRLYALTDRRWTGDLSLVNQVEQALQGGVTCVQLREKNLKDDQLKDLALAIQKLCQSYQVPFIINDHVDLAIEIQADGIHIGQEDMEAGKVRNLIGPNMILGVSTKTLDQARQAQNVGADYLGVGAVFSTDTKDDATIISKSLLKDISETVDIPVVAIGGIKGSNIDNLAGTGIDGVALISAIFAADDITKASQKLRNIVDSITQG